MSIESSCCLWSVWMMLNKQDIILNCINNNNNNKLTAFKR